MVCILRIVGAREEVMRAVVSTDGGKDNGVVRRRPIQVVACRYSPVIPLFLCFATYCEWMRTTMK